MNERIHTTPNWRVVHAFNSALEGWLVVVPRRHVLALADLTEEEAAEIGPLLHRLSQALGDELGCEKTYVMQFAEADGFSHLHFHLVPRQADMPADHRGSGVFHYLTRPKAEWVSAERRDELAQAIGARLTP